MINPQWKKFLRLPAVVLFATLLAMTLHPREAEARKSRKSHHAQSIRKQQVDKSASIVVDAATGAVLSQKNADKRLYPASLTKMMTLYMTFEALDSGTLRKSERMRVSTHASVQEPSALGLQSGSSISVEDAILALVTKSANDAAVVLAERIGGSESGFGRLMTAKARQLGMGSTQFVNASGLFHASQYSTARDMAMLGLALLRDYPNHYRYFSTSSFTWAGQKLKNHNKLMASYAGMDGIKTGYLHKSGFNLVASAVRDGRRLVGVVFGGRTAASRNAQMAALLNASFAAAAQKIAKNTAPQFDAMGLALKNDPYYAARAQRKEEGDASAFEMQQSPVASVTKRPVRREAAPLKKGAWAIQLGAYGSQAAGQQALERAKRKLFHHAASRATAVVVPLGTNRGTIYRARITGIDKKSAESACRLLKGNCLILAMQ